jgi:MFS transporter, PPP family, 3-phenylpropionic acid transporter
VATSSVLRAFYVLSFLFLGAFAHFFPLWLDAQGWSETEIGWATALRFVCVIAFPVMWGRMADRRLGVGFTLGLLAWLSLACFLPLLLVVGFAAIMGTLALFSAFHVGFIPLLEAAAVSEAEASGSNYGDDRLFGSLGFIAGGLGLAVIVEAWGREVIPLSMMVLLALAAALAWACPLKSEARPGAATEVSTGQLELRPLRGFLLLCFLWCLSSHGVYMFLSLHLQELGVADARIPTFWSVGVVSEIVLFRFAPRLLEGRNPRRVMALCYLMCVVQFGLMAWIREPLWLYLVLTLHGVTFGVNYYVSVLWLRSVTPAAHATTAQALLQSVSFGLGGSVSAIGAGYLFELGQGPLTYTVAAALACVTLGALRWCPGAFAGGPLRLARGFD